MKKFIALLLLSGLAGSLPAQTAGADARPTLPEVALDRAVRGEAAIAVLADKMPGVAQHHGITADRLSALLRRDGDLWVDRHGRLFFAESHLPAPALAPESAGGADVQAALVPLDQTFLMHSRPSTSKKIYLDFNGHTTTSTYWSDIKDGDGTFVTPAYDIDGNPASFSTNELERIQYIWQRVAEDYCPFDVDVTTEDPGLEGLRKTSTGDMNYGIRVCIGGASTDWYSTSGYGGVAYIGCFNWNSDTPCYVWPNNLGNGYEKYVAEAISHEVGHTLSLYHDGTSTQGYYAGHGSGADGWAPIMGVGYYQPVVQFSRGEYADANNSEDDLAKITSYVPYLADDHGNDFSSATVLPPGTLYAEGLIERNTDVDLFRFDAGAGTIAISVNVDSRSPNLNAEATLYGASGAVLAVSSPSDRLGASFNLAAMPAGTYYLKVNGVGAGAPLNTGYSDYGSIGVYTITGTVPQSGKPIAVASANPTTGVAPLIVQLSSAGSYDPDGGAVTFSWALGNGSTSTEANPLTIYLTPGVYTAALTVTDDEGLSSSTLVAITVNGVDLAESALGNPPASVAPGASFTVTDTVKNNGLVAAASSTTRYYLSADAVKDGGDLLLGGSRSVASLAAAQTSSGNATVTIPPGTPSGTYYLIACADDLNAVNETDETNNSRASATTLQVVRPDLTVTVVGIPTTPAAAGGVFKVTDTVKNLGAVAAGAFKVRYYLSTDAVKDDGDILLGETRAVSSLSAGQTSNGNLNATIPSATAAGAYYVLSCADDLNAVDETNEANNCRASATTLQVTLPDLVITAIANPPATAAVGGTFRVTDTAKNQGAVTAGASTVRYYLSLDAQKDSGDVLLTGSRAVSSMTAAKTSSGNANVTIPAGTAAGSYYLLACADDLAAVPEVDETNNYRASTGVVVVH